MTRVVRVLLCLVSAGQLFAAVGFFFRVPLALNQWPFPGSTPLTTIFVSSFLAAAGVSTLWVAASEAYASLAGIGLNYMAILGPLAVFSFQLSGSANGGGMLVFGVECALGAVMGLASLVWSLRRPMADARATPSLVRFSFAIFVVSLLAAGLELLLRVPNVIPWSITPDLSVVIGWALAGAAAYFGYGLLRPYWVNAAGQLAGFLVYDLVLIVPFIQHFSNVAPEHFVSLMIYVAVISYSGLVAVYFLLINRPTRIYA
jgi:hypothetical protein